MKKALFTFLVIFPTLCYSQSTIQKLPKDSVIYYQKQLRTLWKTTYDSLVNSKQYKDAYQKLHPVGKKSTNNFGVELTFFTGIQINNYTNLNARLATFNIKAIKPSLLPVGIGLAFRYKAIIFGYDMTAIYIGDNTTGAYVHAYASTNVIKAKNWIFSPQIGFGGQDFRIHVFTTSNSTNFNSYFTTSANQVELTHSNSVADFALACKVYPKKSDTYVPVFRIGYRYALKSAGWEITNGISTNAPYDSNSNFYVQFMLGFGD